eukprot:6824-Heterococcus_DN1.PRE.5
MANSGPHTVGSQFYITYSSCKHLDKKHSVFGAMVGGNAALSAIEAIATDKQDKPSRDVTLVRAVVLQNPIDEMEAALEADLVEKIAAREAIAAAAAAASAKARKTTASSTAATAATAAAASSASDNNQGLRIGWASNPTPEMASNNSRTASGIGKYIGVASGSITLPKLEASLMKANKSNSSSNSAVVDNSASESLAASLAAGASEASEKTKAKLKSGSSSFGNFSSW